jgi:ankyrin repeat protein
VQLLIQEGAKIGARDDYGRTAMHWAAENGHDAVVMLLLEHGVEVRAMDNHGDGQHCNAQSQGGTRQLCSFSSIKEQRLMQRTTMAAPLSTELPRLDLYQSCHSCL